MSVKIQLNWLKVSALLVFMLFFQFVNAQRKPVKVESKFPEIDAKLEAAKKELGGNVVVLIYKDFNKAKNA